MDDIRNIATALIRPAFASDGTQASTCPATVVDVSEWAIGLRVHPDVEVTPNQLLELGVGDTWRRGRVVWSSHGVRESVIVSVEFSEPAPDILSALLGGREPAALVS